MLLSFFKKTAKKKKNLLAAEDRKEVLFQYDNDKMADVGTAQNPKWPKA